MNEKERHAKGSVWTSLARAIGGVSGFVSNRTTYLQMRRIRNQAKPGDILEFQRGAFTHYALYLGDSKVLNLEVEDNRAFQAQIQKRLLSDVCDGCKVHVRSHEDVAGAVFNLLPKQRWEIVKDALTFANKVVPYEHDFRNREYYCTLWRYGKGFSTEVAHKVKAEAASKTYLDKAVADLTEENLFEADGYAKYKRFANNEAGHVCH